MELPTLEAAVCDLDDTIVVCGAMYERVKADLFVWMAGRLSKRADSQLGLSSDALTELAREASAAVYAAGPLMVEMSAVVEAMVARDPDAVPLWTGLQKEISNLRLQDGEWTGRAMRLMEGPLNAATALLWRTLPLIGERAPLITLAAMADGLLAEENHTYESFAKAGDPFSKDVFPLACKKSYLRMCELLGIVPDRSLADAWAAEGFGRKALDIVPDWLMPGAEEMLDYLKDRDMAVAVLTKGPRASSDDSHGVNPQWEKYHLYRLSRWIPEERMRVVSTKTAEDYAALAAPASPEHAVVIGNNWDGDCAPAKQMHRIWIPVKTWQYDSSDLLAEELKDSRWKRLFDTETSTVYRNEKSGLLIMRLESAELVPSTLDTLFAR